ncbi:MAG TPA: amylo-alpha-1,6-glucosidase [Candidatus Gemmiger faecigallinarum]|nr:amylo-alpha-1,6-glucosidase [Candidatus Gemmiger faecigallinarum]
MEQFYGRQDFADAARAQENCFLLTNGLGGYCSLSAAFSATRGDHALLMACLHAPTVRVDLVHRLTEEVAVGKKRFFLSTQEYAGQPDEDGWRNLLLFDAGGPRWVYESSGVRVTRRVAMANGENTAAVLYTLENRAAEPCTLTVTPWLRFVPKGGRMTRRRRFDWQQGRVRSGGLTMYYSVENGGARALPLRHSTLRFCHDAPDGRAPTGLCAAAGCLTFAAAPGETLQAAVVFGLAPGLPRAQAVWDGQARRRREQAAAAGLKSPLARALSAAADAFLVRRDSTGGMTIVAGYPFFTDWGRDTMIALPGCALATGRYADAKSILRTFAAHEKDGLMPNLFPEGDAPPQYNTVDAALLFLNCLWLYHLRTGDDAFVREVWPCAESIVRHYRAGTRHGIRMDADGLLLAGQGLDQVTWMDVRIGTHLPTPRHGKPVEVNAYWYNALRILARLAPIAGTDGAEYDALADRAGASFRRAFWMPGENRLRDVAGDAAGQAGGQLRCNQIWAVSMPFTPLTRAQAEGVARSVRRTLWTPCGLRTLSPDDPEFHPVYGGPQRVRDLAYHQGTVWPFPLGGCYLAELRLGGFSAASRAAVQADLDMLQPALREGCVGQLPEIYDGGAPGASRGCFAQAWSVGEMLRVCEALERPEAAGFAGGWADPEETAQDR